MVVVVVEPLGIETVAVDDVSVNVPFGCWICTMTVTVPPGWLTSKVVIVTVAVVSPHREATVTPMKKFADAIGAPRAKIMTPSIAIVAMSLSRMCMWLPYKWSFVYRRVRQSLLM
ncbi:MAG TPA: hypothetical protein VKV73_02275 [Chloroflexota bacterium]|nr:hypothetical protein [Chloroflexota bacterium]